MAQATHSSAIALVDNRVAKLLIAQPTQGSALDLREIASISNEHAGEHQRNRPDMAKGPGKRSAEGGSGVVGGPHMVNDAHGTEEEETRRFAREVAAWLADRSERTDGQRLHVFASRNFLGELRKQLDGKNARHVELSDGEYAQMPQAELRTHSAIRDALPFG